MEKGRLVEVPIGKKCILVLTREEYIRALQRGKAIRRSKQLAERLAAGRMG